MMVTRTERILRRERMEMTLPNLIDLFLATKQTEGRAQKTISWYRDMINLFKDYLCNGSVPTIKDFTVDNARAFIASLQKQGTRYQDHPVQRGDRGWAVAKHHPRLRARAQSVLLMDARRGTHREQRVGTAEAAQATRTVD